MTALGTPPRVEARYPHPGRHIDPDSTKGWLRRLRPVLLAHRWGIVLTLATSLGAMLSQVLVPYVMMIAIDAVLLEGRGTLEFYAAMVAGLAVARTVFGRVYRYQLQKTGLSVEYDLRVLLYEHFNRLSPAFYDRTPTGQLISRANSDIRALERFLSFAPALVWTFLTFLLAFAFMLRMHVGLSVVALLPLVAVYFAGERLRGRLLPVSWIVQARQADVATVVEENVAGVRIVKSFAMEPQQVDELARHSARLEWATVKQADIRARYGPLMENLPRLSLAIVLLYGGWLVTEGQFTIGALVAFNAYVLMLQVPFRALGFLIMMAQRAAASAQRIFEIFDQQPQIFDRSGARDVPDGQLDLEFREVTFSYGEGEPVLEDFSLRVRPGETMALVGRSGAGKSTVARLVPRLYDVDAGQVLVGGVDVRDLRLSSLRASVGLAMDDPFLFSASIRENIAYGKPEATAQEVEAAARAAGAHAFITAMPEGYDAVVGERGYTLSGGQRQRLAIARTILENPPILILDDATSSVDVHTEARIHAALEELFQERTTLVVAHRFSTIALAHRVALMERGRLVAVGTHEELLAEVPLYREILAQAVVADADADAGEGAS